MSAKQKTIIKEVTFLGIGVHSGESSSVTLKPAGVDAGITIQHPDYPSEVIKIGSIIPEVAMHATVIKQTNWLISTIEHLVAAISALGIDNLIIDVGGFEVPIIDGSALPFIHGIRNSGICMQDGDKKYLTPIEILTFRDDKGRFVEIIPARKNSYGIYDYQLYINYTSDFDHYLIGREVFSGFLTEDFFVQEIAPARTFGFLEQLPFMRKHGLAKGTSLGNTVVIGSEEFMNEVRYPNEFVRHKFLDLVGDLSLLGRPLIGRVNACKTGHSFNRKVIEHYLINPDKWLLV